MYQYPVIEKFVSINGEASRAGSLSVFIRFRGCNLHCSYCDSQYACDEQASVEMLTAQQIRDYILSTGIRQVTLTGGEPLIQPHIWELLLLLSQEETLSIEIETNGSVTIEPFLSLPRRPVFTLDYKLPFSGMEDRMDLSNYQWLAPIDTIKFVAGDFADLICMLEIINRFQLHKRCQIFISPVYGSLPPADIVTFMIDHQLNDVRLQLQLHKFIWDPDKKGV